MNLKDMNDNDLAGSLSETETQINPKVQIAVKMKYELEHCLMEKNKHKSVPIKKKKKSSIDSSSLSAGYRDNVARTMISLDISDLEYIKSYAWKNAVTVSGAIRNIIHEWSKTKQIKTQLPNIRNEWHKAGKPKSKNHAVFVNKAIEY